MWAGRFALHGTDNIFCWQMTKRAPMPPARPKRQPRLAPPADASSTMRKTMTM